MNATAFVPIGRVVKAHGLHGEISVHFETGDPQDVVGLEVWFTPPPDATRNRTVLSVRQGPKGPLLTVSGVDDIDTASSIAGCLLVVRPQDVPDSFMSTTAPVEGLWIDDERRGHLGIVEDVIHTGANDVWVVRGGPFGEVLIPVIDEVVLEIDTEKRLARVRLLPGLLDEG